MGEEKPSAARAWELFDDLVARSSNNGSPWRRVGAETAFTADLTLLGEILSVPLNASLEHRSGMPAKAIDVWLASELRRAGFDPDAIWPRATAPRVLTRELASLRDNSSRTMRDTVSEAILKTPGVGRAESSVLGLHYSKQVDVVMSHWSTGPELLISTKRMDSSLGSNAINRIEESYGDARNLRGRYPQAAIGYLLLLRRGAIETDRQPADRLIDLIMKMGRDPHGYDATCVVVCDWTESDGVFTVDVEPHAPLAGLGAGDFLRTMCLTILERTPIDHHRHARALLGAYPTEA